MRHVDPFLIVLSLLFFSFSGFSQDSFVAYLSGEQEVPAVTTEASGELSLRLVDGDTLVVEGSFHGLESPVDTSIAGGAHLHAAPAGRNGPVVIPLAIELDSEGTSGAFLADANRFALDPATKELLLQRGLYANIHTLDEQAGELRGQVVPAGAQVQYVPLSGDQEVPPVSTEAFGAVLVELYSDSLMVSGSFSSLESELDTSIAGGAHIHAGNADENGPVEFILSADTDSTLTGGTFSTPENTFSINNEERIRMIVGGFYVNIHSTEHGGGELRGQLGNMLNAENYSASLTGRQEVHSVMTTASGSVDAQLVDDLLILSGSFHGLSASVDTTIAGGGHVHSALTGSDGPVEIPLNLDLDSTGTSGRIPAVDNAFQLTPDQMESLRTRSFYINIHTENWAPGEIRGQLLPEADAYYFVKLLGSNEVPAAMTTAKGAVAMEIKDGVLTASGSFGGLRADLATEIAGGVHLHEGRTGQNGPVLFPMTVERAQDLRSGMFLAAENQFSLSAEQMDLISERALYVNVHSQLFPGGEIRGQLSGINSQVAFRAHLSGMNEIPAVMSGASGQVLAELVDTNLVVQGAFDDLVSRVATGLQGGVHLHDGMAGQNGPVLIPVETDFDDDSNFWFFSPADNVFSLESAEIEKLLNRGVYFNVHSVAFRSGEIRGQLLPESQMVFNAQLLSSQAVPNASSMGIGGLKAEVNDGRLTVSGSYENLSSTVDTSIAGGFHLHSGMAGEAGPVAFVLRSDFSDGSLEEARIMPARNQFELDSAQGERLMNRGYYANLHTVDFQSGELRGQLLPEAENYFYAPLSGVAQVPAAVNSEATGMAVLELSGNRSMLTGSFSGLNSNVDTTIAGGVHIHNEWAGANGPVIRLINTSFDGSLQEGQWMSADNQYEWTAGDIVTLMQRGFYVNLHSEEFPAGEIRGQILPPAQMYFRTHLNGRNQIIPNASPGSGAAVVEANRERFVVTGGFRNLVSPLNTDIVGGAHLHAGGADENGGVEHVIQTTLATDSLNGDFLPGSNTFEVDESAIRSLMQENRYLNIHSMAFPNGELRGQVLEEINFFPSEAPGVIAPMSGSTVTVEGDSSQTLEVRWADDGVDENRVVYLWELATDADFDSTVAALNLGRETAFALSYSQLGNLLDFLEVDRGDSVSLHHRVLASDGSVMLPGDASEVTLENGFSTSAENPFADANYQMEVYPTVTDGNVQISAERPKEVINGSSGEIVIRNALGQQLDRIRLDGNASMIRKSYHFQSQNSGMYIFQWMEDGQLVSSQKVMLQ